MPALRRTSARARRSGGLEPRVVERGREQVGDVVGHAVVDDPEVGLLLGEVDLEQRVELEQDAPERQPLAQRDRSGVELLRSTGRSPRRAGAPRRARGASAPSSAGSGASARAPGRAPARRHRRAGCSVPLRNALVSCAARRTSTASPVRSSSPVSGIRSTCWRSRSWCSCATRGRVSVMAGLLGDVAGTGGRLNVSRDRAGRPVRGEAVHLCVTLRGRLRERDEEQRDGPVDGVRQLHERGEEHELHRDGDVDQEDPVAPGRARSAGRGPAPGRTR